MEITAEFYIPESIAKVIDNEEGKRFELKVEGNKVTIKAKDLNILKSLVNRIIKLLITIESIESL